MTKNCEKSGSVKEVIQAARHNDTIANTGHVIRTNLQKKDVEKAVDTTQKVTTARTFALKLRLACLYVSLNNESEKSVHAYQCSSCQQRCFTQNNTRYVS